MRTPRLEVRGDPLAAELPINRATDLLESGALAVHAGRELGLLHADVARRAVLALEAREERHVADAPLASAVAVESVQNPGGLRRRGVGAHPLVGAGEGGRRDHLGGGGARPGLGVPRRGAGPGQGEDGDDSGDGHGGDDPR